MSKKKCLYLVGNIPTRYRLSVPYSLFPVPCSLFPIPYSLFPIPCSLFPVSYFLLFIIVTKNMI
ncbi:MAG: hypothetical protein F6J98_31405 [Moorea sp. SIO4G2]|nr:hypothetical protein [Moorena sp. SIO4G2]